MIYYRLLRKDEPETFKRIPGKKPYNTLELAYANEMPSRKFFTDSRQVWSLAKSPAAALKWFERSKDYNRLAYYDFDGTEGQFFDLTELKTWLGLIEDSDASNLMVNNLNYNMKVPAINLIIPCKKSAFSLAHACEEVIFIPNPGRELTFNIVDDPSQIPLNTGDEKDIITMPHYTDDTIHGLLKQLEPYNIKRKPILEQQLKELLIA